MTEQLYDLCNSMAKDLGYVSWDNLTATMRIPVMQLVQLSLIAIQLEELGRTLR